ncbi:hypothetical protein J1N35_018380 [Gossypium stocksii]|uniref:RNase H type-1 domain-containing protein n=1 Tax=Gossypium stocksii TaxID=47602 RepID=A0A9D3VQK0_9ROSI|nr:hypothetical protein J1N35_018380 [Gossypium stocksii]
MIATIMGEEGEELRREKIKSVNEIEADFGGSGTRVSLVLTLQLPIACVGEALAAVHGLRFTLEIGFLSVILESDSKSSIQFIARSGNQAAHLMARDGMTRMEDYSWVEEAPVLVTLPSMRTEDCLTRLSLGLEKLRFREFINILISLTSSLKCFAHRLFTASLDGLAPVRVSS